MNIALLDLAHDRTVSVPMPMPLNIGYIKAYADKFDSKLNVKLYKQASRFINDLDNTKPDIIGFSNYGWNENLNKAVGNYIRKVLPNSLIVTDSPNLDPGEVKEKFFKKHPYLDIVIVDGGEELLLKLFLGGKTQAEINLNCQKTSCGWIKINWYTLVIGP